MSTPEGDLAGAKGYLAIWHSQLIQQKIKELEREKKKGKKAKGAGTAGGSAGSQGVETTPQQNGRSSQLKTGCGALLEDQSIPSEEKAKRLLEEFVFEQIKEGSRLQDEFLKLGEKVEEAEALLEKAEGESARANAQKERLEGVRKELQKRMEDLQLENQRISEQEKKARQTLAQGFTDSINEVRERMDKQATERLRSIQENDELKSHCRSLAEQYEEREKQLAAQQSQRDLEMSMLNASLKEKEEGYRKDVESATAAARENAILEARVKEMESQLSTHRGKLSTFQGSLSRSTKVFGQYKRERGRMERHVQTLEQEKKTLGERHAKKMEQTKKDTEKALEFKAAAEKRCKDLQRERQELLQELERLEKAGAADGEAVLAGAPAAEKDGIGS